MIGLRRLGCATGSAVQITALLVGELLLAGLKVSMVVSMDQAGSGRRAPLSCGASVRERVAHGRQLIVDRARGCFIDARGREIVLRDIDEARRRGAARRRGVFRRATAAEASDEQHQERATNHPTVFGSAVVCVKAV